MGGLGEEANLPPMTEAQTAELRETVLRLRRTLPDPTARDISDVIADELPDMAKWATSNRVKKLNTKLNKEVKAGAASSRDGCEPDETNGPLVLEELGQWPSDTSLEDHLANDSDTRIFKVSEHHKTVDEGGGGGGGGGGDASSSAAALDHRRNLAAMAAFFDSKYKVWKLCDEEETSELVLVCDGVKWWQNEKKGGGGGGGGGATEEGQIRAVFELEYYQGAPRTGAHKRLVAALMAKHAGDVGRVTASLSSQKIMMTHLQRNRYYEDKYNNTKDGGGGGVDDMLKSYIVTPAPEWFR